MKWPLILLVVLCTAFLATLKIDTAPVSVLPSRYESEAVERQLLLQLDEMRDGNIQADDELEQIFINFASCLLSAASKSANQNDELQKRQFNSESILSSKFNIGKQLGAHENGAVTQSDDETMKILFGTHLMKSIDNGEGHVQSDNDEGLGNTILNTVRKLISALRKKADPNDEVQPTFYDEINIVFSAVEKCLDEGKPDGRGNEITRKYFDAIRNILSAKGRQADPNNELMQTVVSGFKTILSLVLKKGRGLGIEDVTEFSRTLIKIVQTIISALHRNSNLIIKDEAGRIWLDLIDLIFQLAVENLYSGKEPDDDFFFFLRDHINSLILVFVKRFYYRYGGTQLADVVMSVILNLFDNFLSIGSKNADPNDSTKQIVLNRLKMTLSAAKRIISGGGKSKIQSLPEAILDRFGTPGSSLASPKDEVAQKIFPLLNMLQISGTENTIGGGEQEVWHVGKFPTYTAKQFDQRMSMESVDENAAMVEGDNVDLSEEAKMQLWGAILGSLASGVLNRHLSG